MRRKSLDIHCKLGFNLLVNDIESLATEIERRKIARAQAASIEEKLLDGPRLFKMSCEAAKAGLRLDHPNASEEEIHQLLIQRIYGSK